MCRDGCRAAAADEAADCVSGGMDVGLSEAGAFGRRGIEVGMFVEVLIIYYNEENCMLGLGWPDQSVSLPSAVKASVGLSISINNILGLSLCYSTQPSSSPTTHRASLFSIPKLSPIAMISFSDVLVSPKL